MAAILYYLPGHTGLTVNRKQMAAAGLEYALPAVGDPTPGLLSKGPDGGPGAVVWFDDKGASGYKPAEQKWRRSSDGKFWAGYWLNDRPTPKDLQREKVYGGQMVKLRDGNEWLVPRCYAYLEDRSHTLPEILDLNDAGELIGRIEPKYEKITEGAMKWWSLYSRVPDAAPMTVGQEVDLASDAMSVNYRVSKLEIVGLLNLWSTDEYGSVLRAMIDADMQDEWAKAYMQKKSQESAESGLNIGSGATAG